MPSGPAKGMEGEWRMEEAQCDQSKETLLCVCSFIYKVL